MQGNWFRIEYEAGSLLTGTALVYARDEESARLALVSHDVLGKIKSIVPADPSEAINPIVVFLPERLESSVAGTFG